MVLINGRVGQVIGPFEVDKDLIAPGGAIDEMTPETTPPKLSKLGIIAEPGTKVQINEAEVRIGPTGMYELDGTVIVKKLIFLTPTTEDSQVDFVY